jgi:hypothetical protein
MKETGNLASMTLFALALAIGCNHENGEPSSAATPAAATAAPGSASPANGALGEVRDGPADPTDALLRATHTLVLPDVQRSGIRTLEASLEANEGDTRAAFRTLQDDLAVQVRAGAIDANKARTDEDAAIGALKAHISRETETLDALHSMLDPRQRSAAVASVRAGSPGRAEMQGSGAASPPAADQAARRLERLTGELDLDAGQQKKVAALLATQPTPRPTQQEQRRARMDMVLDNFAADTFDAKLVAAAPPAAPLDPVRDGIDGEISFLQQVLPILTADQRDKLASSLQTPRMPRGE